MSEEKILTQLKNKPLSFGEAALCRLGQHSFLVKLGETILAVDPYLSPEARRLVPPPVPAEEFIGVDWILSTHDHADHLDRASLARMAEASPKARLVVPEAILESVTEFPADRLLGINAPGKRCLGDVTIWAIPAAHERLERDAGGNYAALGYVIHGNGFTLYHSGDCCIYPGLAEMLTPFALDLALLPINGRDAVRLARGCIGNMNFAEAADLAGTIGVPVAVPAHYDMFALNSEDPEKFTSYMKVKYPDAEAVVMAPGEIRVFRCKALPDQRRANEKVLPYSAKAGSDD